LTENKFIHQNNLDFPGTDIATLRIY